MDNLKQKAVKGIFWSGLDSFGVYFIKFAFTIWIARLLIPKDYGLIGLMSIFIALGQMFADSGLQTALIQKKDTTQEDYSTVFLFNLTVGLIAYLIIFFSAEVIAAFFNEPELTTIARVISLSLVISPLASIQLTQLSKELNFKKQAKISFLATLISGCTGVILALEGFAVWALVFQTLSGAFIRIVLLWFRSSWRPSLLFSINSFKKLYSYGWKIFLQGLIDNVFSNIYYPIIGKVFSTAALGYYTRAKRFQDLIIKQFSIFTGKVFFPAFSSIQNDKTKFFTTSIKITRLIIYFTYPVLTYLILVSEPFVRLALTEKWLPIVPFMQLLFIEGFFFPLFQFNNVLVASIGRSDLSLQNEIVRKVLLFISILIGLRYGIVGLIIGQILSTFVSLLYSIVILNRNFKILYSDIYFEIIKVSLISLIVFLPVTFITKFLINDILSILISLIPFLFYFTITKYSKIKSYLDFKELVSPYIQNKLILRVIN